MSKEAGSGRIISNISHQWRGILVKIGVLNFLTLVQLKNDQPLDKAFLNKQSEEIGKLFNFISNTINTALKNDIEIPYFRVVFSQDEINIFDNARRVPTLPNETDMGLGIYICIKLVKKHGGEIAYTITSQMALTLKYGF